MKRRREAGDYYSGYITEARVTAVSVIKPVMMIRFHQAGGMKKTHLFQRVKVVSQ